MNIYERINADIIGRLALMGADEAELLYRIVGETLGDHVEIGTLWGGTAILAALAKWNGGKGGHIYTIDFMTGGYWNSGDPGADMKRPTAAAILDNLARFKVAERVSVIKARSYPWPLIAVKPATVLIDGDHSFEGCMRDWQTVSRLEPEIILIHDYASGRHPGVEQAVNEIMESTQWHESERAGTLIALRK